MRSLGHVVLSIQLGEQKKDINLLEDVQRRYTKLVKCLKDCEYEEKGSITKNSTHYLGWIRGT